MRQKLGLTVVFFILLINFFVILGFLAKALNEYHTSGDAKKALHFLSKQNNIKHNKNRLLSVEENILNLLSTNLSNFKGAILNLPRDMRSLYIHAYQSLVFNKILSKLVFIVY